MISTLIRGLASLLAVMLTLGLVAPWAHARPPAGAQIGVDADARADLLDDDAVAALLPTNRPRPIAGALCDEAEATGVRRGVTYTCTEQADGALVWVPDAKTVKLGAPCLVRGEHALDPAPRAAGTDAALLACAPGSGGALAWASASRVCISSVAARDEVASEYAHAMQQLTSLNDRLREVRATERVSLNRQIVPLRTSVATMNGLLTRLSSAARTACGR